MAQFRIGQRVRIVASSAEHDLKGVETHITGPAYDSPRGVGYPTAATDGKYKGVLEWALAPLADPKADAFIERLKKLGNEPVNDVEKVTK